MIAVREHVRAEATGEERDVESIELTSEHFERALEEVSADVTREFVAGEFGDVPEGAGGEA
ncbi:hypothetical protein [Natrinema longum]|uniref:Uncharacterized protein n=1 Tax=Natrinema longum TaxID=370324 RepID=A0A8A2UFY6_9EURY|nr:hypothetical protein [Natrinema longum]MBZ6496363.1 hypothetical protein [Natrinema longum]QSW87032.1 hypothetical protein J0X27_02485 [Natrinema longum]